MYKLFKREKELVEQTLTDLRAGYNSTQLLHLFGGADYDKEALASHAQEPLSPRALQTVHAEIRYAPYIEREQREIKRIKQYSGLTIPKGFSYKGISGLSNELQEKLTRYKPQTIAQAALIPGMTPAAISLLIFVVQRKTTNNSLSEPIP